MTKRSEPTTAVEKPRAAPAEYNDFISGVEIRDLRVSNARIRAPEAFANRELEAELGVGKATYETLDGGFLVRQTFRFRGRYKGTTDHAVSIEVEFSLRYTSRDPITEPIFAVFKEVNVPLNAWPYFREFVHSSLGRAQWPSLVIPAFKTAGK